MKTYAHGFPQIGENHEFRHAVEGFLSSRSSQALSAALLSIDARRSEAYGRHVDSYASGEVTRFDSVLDAAILCGLYDVPDDASYYSLCVGASRLTRKPWFTTNRSYLVPDFGKKKAADLRLVPPKTHGSDGTPGSGGDPAAVLGPFTLLRLAKGIDHKNFGDYLHALALIYRDLLSANGALWVHEPGFALEVTQEQISRAAHCYETISAAGGDVTLFTYYDDVDFLSDLMAFPVAAIGLDFVGGDSNLTEIIERGFPSDKTLLAGLVDGRSIWRTPVDEAVDTLAALKGAGVRKLMVGNGAPLYHLPLTTAGEDFDIELDESVAFATERLLEIATIAEYFDQGTKWTPRAWFTFHHDEAVRSEVARLREEYRSGQQAEDAQSRSGLSSGVKHASHTTSVLPIIAPPDAVKLAHADERGAPADGTGGDAQGPATGGIIPLVGTDDPTDLVERAVAGLRGVVTTKHGYLITHGIAEYRPPIIVGDIARRSSLSYATSGDAAASGDKRRAVAIVPGPMTITGWSYVRTDVDPIDFAYQAALALRDEVREIEKLGFGNLLVEEPGLGGMAPAKRREWFDYYSASTRLVGLVGDAAGPNMLVHLGLRPGAAAEAGRHMGELEVDGIVVGMGDELELVTRRILRAGHRGVLILQADETTKPEFLHDAIAHLCEAADVGRIWLMIGCTATSAETACASDLVDRLRPAIERFSNQS